MKPFLLLLLLLVSIHSFSQEDAWVYFADKPNGNTYLANPLTMLTQRSLNRRLKQNITLDTKDIPIDLNYVNQVKNAVGIEVKAKSRWLNAVHVFGAEANIKALKVNLSFVTSIQFANKNIAFKGLRSEAVKKNSKFEKVGTNFNYGSSSTQINMLHGDYLHQQNYTGLGMVIAVIDAGFPGVNTFDGFKRLRDNNQILGGYDFVNHSNNFYTGNSHGASVLSTMAGFVDGSLVGTAPDASYYLFISEDNNQESPLEESLWVEAAERADSLGVDVLNTSLGYSTFDNPNYDYAYADMNGATTFISRGAEIAFSRGMIIVNAAGNEGSSTWHYISAPADAPSVLSIGAVNASQVAANFSSFGPTFDNRIKPDVDAMGISSILINNSGIVSAGNGTSFASPIMAGMVACLWQAHPNATNLQITEAIKNSGSLFASPTAQLGYGIPNFQSAFTTLDVQEHRLKTLGFYPNPVKENIYIIAPMATSVKVKIMDILGKTVYQKNRKHLESIHLSFLAQGMYVIDLNTENQHQTFKLIKQ